MTSVQPEPAPSRLGVLRERNFRLFFSGYTLSLFGSSMVPVALSFAVLNEGRGADAIGYVLAAETIPLVALLLLGGVIADRFSRRFTMLGADVVRFASEAALAGALLAGRPPLWILMVLAGVLGAGQVSAACLWRLVIPPHAARVDSSLLAQLAQGWREFRSRTWLWLIVGQFATFNALCFGPFMVLGAVTAHDQLGGAGAWGAILAALGVGSVLGGLATIRLHPRHPLVVAEIGVAFFAAPVALLALPAPTALIAAAAGIAGVGLSVFGTLWETALQHHVPPDVLSRVSSYDWFGSVAFVPLGYLVAGPVAGLIGTRTLLFIAAAWAVASCLPVLLSREVQRLGRPPGKTE